jgi:hypothetical protein
MVAAIEKRGLVSQPHQTYQPAGGLPIPKLVCAECSELRMQDGVISIFVSKAGHAGEFRNYLRVNHRIIARVEWTPHSLQGVRQLMPCDVKDRSQDRLLRARFSQSEKQNWCHAAIFVGMTSPEPSCVPRIELIS